MGKLALLLITFAGLSWIGFAFVPVHVVAKLAVNAVLMLLLAVLAGLLLGAKPEGRADG